MPRLQSYESQSPITDMTSLPTTTPQTRLNQLTAHMGSSKGTNFTAEVVPQAPEDPLFGLMAAFRRDSDSNKVDLGIGAYRDNNAKPWVLPVVRKVSR